MKVRLTILTTLFNLLLVENVVAVPKLFIPKNPKANTALFVVLHGCLSTSEDSEQNTRMSEFGENNGFYVYYPEPYLGEEESKGCFEFYTKDSQKVGGGDAAKIIERINDIVSKYDIDRKKIFVMGMSGGASLVSVLASCYPNQISGAVIHSGMGYGLASDWKQSLLVAQTGPLPTKGRNTSCNFRDYKGKVVLIQGSRDMVMNPAHYSALKNDFLSGTESTTDIIPSRRGRYGYLHEKFFSNGEIVGQGIFVLGMNHEWSGYKSQNPVGPIGPDVSQMIVEYFLGNIN
jgi:poly(hydroxyalkanoate) depolymerase family esterase